MTDAEELVSAILDFFMASMELPDCPPDIAVGAVWLERDGAHTYAWRIIERRSGVAYGRPVQDSKGAGL